jgi:diguanylate cyclase (GGDEF)-like protein
VFTGSPQRIPRRRVHLVASVVGFGSLYFCLDYALNRFAFSSGWTILWPLNGLTIAILLRQKRRDWPAILMGVAIGTGIGECLDNNPLGSEILQRLISLVEVTVSASLLPQFSTLDRWLRTPRLFLRFVLALLLGPGISGVLAAILFHLTQNLPYLLGFNNWATADALGIAATMPLTLSARSVEMRAIFRGRATLRTLCIVAFALGVVGVIFSVSRYPLLFLLYPALLFVDSLLAFPGAALVAGLACLIAVYCTIHGYGPFGVWAADLGIPRDVALQIYLGFHLVALFPASLLFMERKRMAVKLRDSNAQLQMLASLDGLTSISNRRSLDDRFELEWKRALRVQAPLALLMVDIDHFKQFNDFYGHQAGDECLRRVARTLASRVRRPEDLVARYGGEEFAVLLPHTELEGALILAEELRAAILGLAIEHSGSPSGCITVSIGSSACRPSNGWIRSELLQSADAALYKAKQAGRNRVEAGMLARNLC